MTADKPREGSTFLATYRQTNGVCVRRWFLADWSSDVVGKICVEIGELPRDLLVTHINPEIELEIL